MGKLACYKIRSEEPADLLKRLDELKKELSYLRVQQIGGSGLGSKGLKIRTARRNIARVLTVYNQKRKDEARAKWAKKKFIPIDLRPKKTRAIRRELTKAQLEKKTLKQRKKLTNLPRRKYALVA
eukprot:Platyproteum_vivax@DN12107_c0_g1_i1.p2